MMTLGSGSWASFCQKRESMQVLQISYTCDIVSKKLDAIRYKY